MGLLVSGASMANVVGLAAARHRAAQRLGWSVRESGLQGDHPGLEWFSYPIQSHGIGPTGPRG